MITTSIIILLTVVCVVTYAFEITFGLAGTIIMLAVMTPFVDPKILVIYSILPQLLVATIGLSRSPKTVDLKVLFGMVGVAALGSLCGFYIFYALPSDSFKILLAAAITLSGLYLVAKPGRVKLNQTIARGLDFIGGISQAVFGISGPIAMTRLMSTHTDKMVIRNYALAFFLSLNLFRGGNYIIYGDISDDILKMMLISAPVLAISLWYSNHLHFKVSDGIFKTVVSWVILFGGVSLFFTGNAA